MISKLNLEKYLKEISKNGYEKGKGVTRSAYSEEDKKTKDFIISFAKNLGLKYWEDSVGTLFIYKNGESKDLPCVMFGSHYDSVFHGGKYDGVVGVISAMEVLRDLVEEGFENKYPLVLIAMNAEEGETFGPSTGVTNSRAMVGTLTEEELNKVKNRHGLTKKEAMLKYGLDADLKKCIWKKGSIKNFVEMHIEQGPILENEGKTIGVIEYLPGIGRYKLRFYGKNDDSTAKMNKRKDALLAASKFTVKFNEYMTSLGDDITGSVNEMNISPNSNQFIASFVEAKIEIRTFNKNILEKIDMIEKINEILKSACDDIGVSFEIEDMRRIGYPNPTPPSVMNKNNTKKLMEIAEKFSYPAMIINKGTGHDSMIMTDFTDTNMIYLPSHKGISHHKDEFTSLDDIEKGTNVLSEFIKYLSK